MTEAIRLADRGVLEVAGEDASKFLHNILTNDIAALTPGAARYAALLTPQGKILFDFLVFAQDATHFLIDCPRALSDDLLKRLALYKLRAKIELANRSDTLEAVAFIGATDAADAAAGGSSLALAPDPRDARLGWRAIAPKGAIPASDDAAPYEALRIAVGAPKGGVDFDYGGTFPHEANMDLLAGLDFKKGCYVGQEVVSRMKHRGLVRKRVAPYRAPLAPAPGETIRAGEVEIGVTGSSAGDKGLALIRLDRLGEAIEKGDAPVAAGVTLSFDDLAALKA